MTATAGDVPPEVEDRIRAVCMALPDAYEEPAWVGMRWMVRRKTFAHTYSVERAGGPVDVVTFRAPDDEVAGLLGSGFPFSNPGWGANVVSMVLDADTDWTEVAELLTESYRVRAPRKLSRLVDEP
jgi:hypothetical protein